MRSAVRACQRPPRLSNWYLTGRGENGEKSRVVRRGFTMIEMLVVIGILIIVAGMTYGIMKMVWVRNAEAVTRARMGVLEDGIYRYYQKHGFYPVRSPQPGTNEINKHRLTEAWVRSWGTVDMNGVTVVGGYVVDYWKTPIRYRCPGVMNTKTYDIWSCGANKKDGTGTGDLATALTRDPSDDDICNWRGN